MMLSDWIMGCQPGCHVLVMVSAQSIKIGGQVIISLIEQLTSMACILSFIKLIQLKFLYDTIKGVFLIGAKLQSDTMYDETLSPSQNMQFYKEQTRTHPMFSPACTSITCSSTRMNIWKSILLQRVIHLLHSTINVWDWLLALRFIMRKITPLQKSKHIHMFSEINSAHKKV